MGSFLKSEKHFSKLFEDLFIQYVKKENLPLEQRENITRW
jgi:hypothetical protein